MTEKAKTVLIVDDDLDVLDQYRIMLDAGGFHVISAESKAEALKILETESPDLAIVDLMLEEVDAGFVLCHAIKSNHSSIPIILVTSVTHETGLKFDVATDEARSWIKADALLAKPVLPEQLMNEIGKLLERE